MCSFSSNAGELWVSLVEKAFLKAMGGYHFPGTMTTPMHYSRSCSNGCFRVSGSNGGIDLHILTGWIPERVGMESEDFKADRIWQRMVHAYKFGDCLITASTGQPGR